MKIGEVKGMAPGETIQVHRELGCVKIVLTGQPLGLRTIEVPLQWSCTGLADLILKARNA